MQLPCSDWTALHPPAVGRNSRRRIWTTLRWPDDLQLHTNQPIPHLPAALSPSLSRWLEGEGHSRGHVVRSCLRASTGSFVSARRSRSSPVCRVVGLPEPGLAFLQPRLLGSPAPARNYAVNPVLPGQPYPSAKAPK